MEHERSSELSSRMERPAVIVPANGRPHAPVAAPPHSGGITVRRALLSLVLAVVLFGLLEGLVFRSGFYNGWVEPNSTAGYLLLRLGIEKARAKTGPNQVLGIGDSRMPLLPRITDTLNSETGYTFGNISVAGTNPRCWYYMLRDVDPDARAYAAILIPMYQYDDPDWGSPAEADSDIHYLVPLLRASDAWDFSSSFPTWPLRWLALRASLFKGLAYKRDVVDLLVHYRERLNRIRWNRAYGAKVQYEYVGDSTSLAGLEVDWNARKVTRYPDSAPPAIRQALDAVMTHPIVYTGQLHAYRRLWLGRIIARYRGSRTRLIFFRLPRGPVVNPNAGPVPASVLREFAARGEVTLIDENRFNELERPELFKDHVHMNPAGCEKFSVLMAREVARILGPAKKGR